MFGTIMSAFPQRVPMCFAKASGFNYQSLLALLRTATGYEEPQVKEENVEEAQVEEKPKKKKNK